MDKEQLSQTGNMHHNGFLAVETSLFKVPEHLARLFQGFNGLNRQRSSSQVKDLLCQVRANMQQMVITTAAPEKDAKNKTMDQLRNELAEAQTALSKKEKQYKTLEEEYQSTLREWQGTKSQLLARIRGLENENKQFSSHSKAVAKEASKDQEISKQSVRIRELEAEVQRLQMAKSEEGSSSGGSKSKKDESPNVKKDGDVEQKMDETVIMTRSQIEFGEKKYKGVKEKLAQKEQECLGLQQQQSISSMPPDLITEEHVTIQWQTLRDKIRTLSLSRFNKPVPIKNVLEQERKAFDQLSPHWKTYLTTESMTCYIFRALIWRHLYHSVFEPLGKVWGQPVRDGFASMMHIIRKTEKVNEDKFIEWRVHTGKLLNSCYTRDTEFLMDTSSKIYEAVTKFANGIDVEGLKKALTDIVLLAGDLSISFASAKVVPLMSDRPGSHLMNGFAYHETTMDLRARCGKEGVVDLVFSPCLLKRVPNDFEVLVRAEVVC